MRLLRLVLCATLMLVAVGLVAASPSVPARGLMQIILRDYSDLYAWMVEDRRLGSPHDEDLLRNLQAHSSVEHFQHGSSDPIAVVKLELLNDDGTSRTRSKYGNYPFYVVRETPRGLVLMGKMFGGTYRSTLVGGKREFFVELHRSAARVAQMHFRVEDGKLVNLSAPARKGSDLIAVAAR